MAGGVKQFFASDAFIYTDTYRKAIKLSAATIATEKERLKGRARSASGGFDSRYYAELRGLEHAVDFLIRREEPKLVLLGEKEADGASAEDREAKLSGSLVEVQKLLIREKEQKEKLKTDLKAVGNAYAKLQAESMQLRQLSTRLQRKVAQTSSTFGVVGFAMFVVIVVLLLTVIK